MQTLAAGCPRGAPGELWRRDADDRARQPAQLSITGRLRNGCHVCSGPPIRRGFVQLRGGDPASRARPLNVCGVPIHALSVVKKPHLTACFCFPPLLSRLFLAHAYLKLSWRKPRHVADTLGCERRLPGDGKSYILRQAGLQSSPVPPPTPFLVSRALRLTVPQQHSPPLPRIDQNNSRSPWVLTEPACPLLTLSVRTVVATARRLPPSAPQL